MTSMRTLTYLAAVALFSCGIGTAQSSDSSAQGTQATQNSQGAASTPTGDSRDQYGNVVAPDGTVRPKGTDTPGANSSSQPSASTTDAQKNQSTTRPTPPGDRRDRYGDTVAPDGSVTPKGANSQSPSDSSQSTAPNK